MAVLINPESEETKERAKWEMFHSQWTPGGLQPGNPYRKGNVYGKAGAEYPKMLYKAQRIPGNGKWATSMDVPEYFGFRTDDEWRRACERAERFTASCQLTVNTEAEHARAREEGYRDTPKEAVDFQHALEKEMGDAAANRNWHERNMSEKALAERDAAEAEHFGHLPEIPEKPIVRRVKKGKGSSAPAA